ncbi:MAG: CHAP domain-containing protein [Oscillospiraceae bacterium]|nr:CHAP domain-containing protein [Oscillospiraceae bacterium]
MVTRKKLAEIAEAEAQRCFHGSVMQTEHNLHPIISPFPWFDIEEADRKWCAAFVYYCCLKAGFKIPIRPTECRSCNLAGCGAWEELAIADENIMYIRDSNFAPEAGDIVLYDRVWIDVEHDHIGIVIENKADSIIAAEGNLNNVSGVIERKKDSHIRAYIRLPDDYEYENGG